MPDQDAVIAITAETPDMQDDKTLDLILRYIESPHTERMTCQFDESTISVDIQESFVYGSRHLILKGVLE